MSTNTDRIIRILSTIDGLQDVRVSVDKSGVGALVCGGASFVGGLLLGPVGLFVGGTLGSLAAYQMNKDGFQPLSTLLREKLTRCERQRLIEDIRNAMRQLDYVDILQFLAACSSGREAFNLLLETIRAFLRREGYQII